MLPLVLLLLAWPGPAERQAEVERLRRDESYQRALPVGDGGVDDAGADRGLPAARPVRSTGQGGEGLGSLLLWFLIGGSALALVAVGTREVLTRPARVRPASSAAPLPTVRLDAGALEDAEVLAKQGDFGAAVHALLLRTFAAIGRQALLPEALTSREILAQVAMQPEARQALGHLIRTVELSLFGTAEATAEDYARCRASYQVVQSAKGVTVG